MNDKPMCKCGETKNLSYEPKASMLLFGPYKGSGPYSMEYRCPKCEKELSKKLLGVLK